MKLATDPDMMITATEAVTECFAEVPFCKVKFSRPTRAESLPVTLRRAELRTSEKDLTLLIEARRSGQPRFVRDAINSLERQKIRYPNAYGILVAPFISDGAAELLAKENLGYIDLAGNCRISVDGIFIRKEGKENRFTKKRDLRSLYSPKGERIIRTMLLDPSREWKVELLASEAHVSLGQVSNVKRLLEAREWVVRALGGMKLVQPEKLLAEWANAYQFRRHRVFECYSADSLIDIEARIASGRSGELLGVLTGFSAAARFSPAVRYIRASAFIRESAEVVAKGIGLKPVTSGGNVFLIEPYDEGVFFGSRQIAEVQVVSPAQTYLDLLAAPGRGAEAAEALLREVLKPSW